MMRSMKCLLYMLKRKWGLLEFKSLGVNFLSSDLFSFLFYHPVCDCNSFNCLFLYVSGTTLDFVDIAMDQTDKILCPHRAFCGEGGRNK